MNVRLDTGVGWHWTLAWIDEVPTSGPELSRIQYADSYGNQQTKMDNCPRCVHVPCVPLSRALAPPPAQNHDALVSTCAETMSCALSRHVRCPVRCPVCSSVCCFLTRAHTRSLVKDLGAASKAAISGIQVQTRGQCDSVDVDQQYEHECGFCVADQILRLASADEADRPRPKRGHLRIKLAAAMIGVEPWARD